MRALKIILGLLVAIIVVVLAVGVFLPKEYEVVRTIEIDAPPEVVFDEVNTLRDWEAWSPWLAGDPTIESKYSGPASGVGAKVTWTSEHSGNGTQTIMLSERPTRIETHLDFGNMGRPEAYWTFEPQDDGTQVTWGLEGTATGPIGGYFAIMIDDWVGSDYEDGLRRLKHVVEAEEK